MYKKRILVLFFTTWMFQLIWLVKEFLECSNFDYFLLVKLNWFIKFNAVSWFTEVITSFNTENWHQQRFKF